VDPSNMNKINKALRALTPIYEIGSVICGNKKVMLK